MDLHILQTGIFKVNTIIVPLAEKKCFIVDPAACPLSGDASIIVDYLFSKKLECVAVILTHAHFDHIMGIKQIVDAFPDTVVAVHQDDYAEMQNPPGPLGKGVIDFFGMPGLLELVQNQPSANFTLNNDQSLSVICKHLKTSLTSEVQNALSLWKVIHTPGHTPGSICLYNSTKNLLISGDTIFDWGGYGRTDMPGGDEDAIVKSITMLHSTLPAQTKVYPGHDSFGFFLE